MNAERNPFSPLYVHHAAFISLFNLRAVGGEKVRTRFWKISKSRRRSAAPKYPLAFLQRADLKELLNSKVRETGVTTTRIFSVAMSAKRFHRNQRY